MKLFHMKNCRKFTQITNIFLSVTQHLMRLCLMYMKSPLILVLRSLIFPHLNFAQKQILGAIIVYILSTRYLIFGLFQVHASYTRLNLFVELNFQLFQIVFLAPIVPKFIALKLFFLIAFTHEKLLRYFKVLMIKKKRRRKT